MRRGELMPQKEKITIDPKMAAELKRLHQLEKGHKQFVMEHDLLKKAIYEFMNSQRHFYPLTKMCRFYCVSRHGFNSWKRRGMSHREKKDKNIYNTIYTVWKKSVQLYTKHEPAHEMNDNAHIESFFHNFKAERIHGKKTFIKEDTLRGVITQYVGFYNKKRIHSSLGYLVPGAFERRIESLN